MSRISKKQILNRLQAISKAQDGSSPFIVADLVSQEVLYEIQNDLAHLMLQIAESIGTAETLRLAKEFPYLYRTEEAS